MSLTHEDVARIAKLARIKVSGAEIEAVGADLNRIFGLIEKMNAVDTDGIEPMAHPQDVSLRLRDDAVTASNRRDAFQAVAPQVEAGLYLVPKVIE
ncbi:Asp-tRNA(Asn)/Glu-tRNA(Gln) amidotransferase subunit GatC [Crenobacter cavernae]|uniref:Aspartyl/glutamyl-tRNA(Asn/Gln) amidotransferase subunit C n=1 Tax=Crenobacter cavernae TaxID=2290923 RepID=A0A345Y4A4_9NEIS|nr:Asp-tRNA(Asn)/Glu-tRNA(Gln) amidotransferase subunit GatC [Crenobacter cavernae]AXK38756.1 Asp-tRNA(Asn)/Glu-tRNA(Gln) amidotransferase subunit GatC [Crenobacter cavernae]RXZ44447.1 Asp-tRNA(Asn)/Glu-tRNA(Gln) amidotransferase subunit GatC [Crenobacter cavernae]